MRLYEINKVRTDALVAITLESGKHICCPIRKLYISYTESLSKNRLKRDGHITSVVFYNKEWVDNQYITIPLPLEEADWETGMYITPENFTNILKYIVCRKFCNADIDIFDAIQLDPTEPKEKEINKLYDAVSLYSKMTSEEFYSIKNPFIDYCDEFLELLYDKPKVYDVFAMLLKAKELTI